MLDNMYTYIRKRGIQKKVIPVHTHDKYEFVYFYSGSGTLEYDGAAYPFEAGSYYLIRPNLPHAETYSHMGESVVAWLDLPDGLHVDTCIQHDAKLNLSGLATQIYSEIKKRPYRHDLLVHSLICQIVTLLARQQHTKESGQGYGLRDSINYIDQYYMTAVRTDDLAKECGYSADHYRVLFKQATSLTPKEYILQKRLSLACSLLQDNRLSIADIAVQCGFEYYSQFMAFFKKRTGMSPSRYRAGAADKSGPT